MHGAEQEPGWVPLHPRAEASPGTLVRSPRTSLLTTVKPGFERRVRRLTRRRAKRNVDGMWRIVRTLLFALALAGSIGQASAFAAPEQPGAAADAMAAMPDCAEMMMQAGAEGPASPCDDAGPDCMGRTACFAVAVPLPSGAGFTVRPPTPHRQQVALGCDDTRAGERPAPLGNPPKTQA